MSTRLPESFGINQSDELDHGLDDSSVSEFPVKLLPSDDRETIPIIDEQPRIPITKTQANLLLRVLDKFPTPMPKLARINETHRGGYEIGGVF
jgi:hypothetical protein